MLGRLRGLHSLLNSTKGHLGVGCFQLKGPFSTSAYMLASYKTCPPQQAFAGAGFQTGASAPGIVEFETSLEQVCFKL